MDHNLLFIIFLFFALLILSIGIVIGFGRIVITVSVWADNAPLVSKSIPGFLLLFFILTF